MRDLRIELKFKNAILYNALKEKYGHLTPTGEGFLTHAAKSIGIPVQYLYEIINIKASPFRKRGSRSSPELVWRNICLTLSDNLNIPVEELFPEALYKIKIPPNAYVEIASERVLSLQEAAEQKLLPSYDLEIEAMDFKEHLNRCLTLLTPREEKVIRMRFGLDNGQGMDLRIVGEHFGVGPERIRQIEAKAMRKMRHPKISAVLKPYILK